VHFFVPLFTPKDGMTVRLDADLPEVVRIADVLEKLGLDR